MFAWMEKAKLTHPYNAIERGPISLYTVHWMWKGALRQNPDPEFKQQPKVDEF